MSNNQLLVEALYKAQNAIGLAIAALQQPQKAKPTPRPTPKPKRAPRGDLGLLRQCLADCNYQNDQIMYNNLRKDGTRRLKIWGCGTIKGSPEVKQAVLWDMFGKVFGDRFMGAQYIENPVWYGGYSLTIVLKDAK